MLIASLKPGERVRLNAAEMKATGAPLVEVYNEAGQLLGTVDGSDRFNNQVNENPQSIHAEVLGFLNETFPAQCLTNNKICVNY